MATTYIVTPEIAEILRETRVSQRKSQSQVARALNASQTTIQKLEIGQAKESSFLKHLWNYYGLPADRFEELQNRKRELREQYLSTMPSAPIVEHLKTWQQTLQPPPAPQQTSTSDEFNAEMTNEMLGQVVRNITQEYLVRVVEGRVKTARRGGEPAQMALHLTRANGTEIRVVMTRTLAHEIATQILRNGE